MENYHVFSRNMAGSCKTQIVLSGQEQSNKQESFQAFHFSSTRFHSESKKKSAYVKMSVIMKHKENNLLNSYLKTYN